MKTHNITSKKLNDVIVWHEGGLYLVRPVSTRATEWIEENVQDDARWFGPSLVVEHRFIQGLIEGMEADGLVVA